MKTRARRNGTRRQASLFEERTPTLVHEPERVAAIVDALAELLLEAARPSRSARSEGGQDDESQDQG